MFSLLQTPFVYFPAKKSPGVQSASPSLPVITDTPPITIHACLFLSIRGVFSPHSIGECCLPHLGKKVPANLLVL